MQSKKGQGQVGLDTAKAVMVVLLALGVLAFAIVIVLANVNQTDVAATTGSGSASNETITSVTEASQDFAEAGRADVACTLTSVDALNSSSDLVTGIGNGNYTQTNCAIAFMGADTQFNNTDWFVFYSFNYNAFDTTSGNITEGIEEFFSNATVWFSLLAVVVIILIIGIVIIAVNHFGGRSGSGL